MRAHVVRLERMVFAISAVIVLGTVGAAIGLDAGTPHDPHPELTTALDGAPWDDGDARAVPWVAENTSTWDVEDVEVSVRLGDGEPVIQQIDYLPRGARRHGVARLPRADGEPVVTIVGYGLP